MEEEEDRGVSLARSRSTISDRRFSYLERDLERDAPRRVSREEEKEKKEESGKEREGRRIEKETNWTTGQRGRGKALIIIINNDIDRD